MCKKKVIGARTSARLVISDRPRRFGIGGYAGVAAVEESGRNSSTVYCAMESAAGDARRDTGCIGGDGGQRIEGCDNWVAGAARSLSCGRSKRSWRFRARGDFESAFTGGFACVQRADDRLKGGKMRARYGVPVSELTGP